MSDEDMIKIASGISISILFYFLWILGAIALAAGIYYLTGNDDG